jgi:retinol dehydrogenase 12
MDMGAKPKSEGGLGVAQEFWDWTEEQIKPYL